MSARYYIRQGGLDDDDNFEGFTHKQHRTSRTYKNVFYPVQLSRVGGKRQMCVSKTGHSVIFQRLQTWDSKSVLHDRAVRAGLV